MLIVDHSPYTAIKSRIIKVRISTAWVFHSSDLKRPKAVQVTERNRRHSANERSLGIKTATFRNKTSTKS